MGRVWVDKHYFDEYTHPSIKEKWKFKCPECHIESHEQVFPSTTGYVFCRNNNCPVECFSNVGYYKIEKPNENEAKNLLKEVVNDLKKKGLTKEQISRY